MRFSRFVIVMCLLLCCCTSCTTEGREGNIIPWTEEIDYILISKAPSPPTTRKVTSEQAVSEMAAFINEYQAKGLHMDPFGGWEIQVTVVYQEHSHEDTGFCLSRDSSQDIISCSDGSYFSVGSDFRSRLLEFYEGGEAVSDD